ncbi:MAG: Spore germination protein YndE [Candidatus Dichloromethanomonas elyunquensis]|nr:MAG: Spore germination protein YndE [Candidatus Dichloromethanomonas elyunquensis]
MKISPSTKLTSFQILAVFISLRVLVSFSFTPTLRLPPANQDAWMIDLLTGFYIVILYIPSLFLMNRFRNVFFTEYYELIVGKWIGKILSFLTSLYLLYWPFFFTVILIDFIKTTTLTKTPMYVIAGILVAIGVYAAFKGLESQLRAAEVFVFYIIGIVIIFTILGFNKMDFSVFLPVLSDSSFLTLNKSALFLGAGRFSDGVFLLGISAFLDKKYSIIRCLIIGIIVFTLFSMLMTVSIQAVLGVELPKHMNFPYFAFARQIDAFHIFQRIEFFSVAAWIFGFLFKLCPFLTLSAMIMKEVYGAKSEKPFIIPLAVLVYILIITTAVASNPFYRKILFVYIYYAINFFTFAIPLFVFIVYFFRRKSIKNRGY